MVTLSINHLSECCPVLFYSNIHKVSSTAISDIEKSLVLRHTFGSDGISTIALKWSIDSEYRVTNSFPKVKGETCEKTYTLVGV